MSLEETVQSLSKTGTRQIKLPSGGVIIIHRSPIKSTEDQIKTIRKIPTVDLPPLDDDGENTDN